jgi:hypothetical protein
VRDSGLLGPVSLSPMEPVQPPAPAPTSSEAP